MWEWITQVDWEKAGQGLAYLLVAILLVREYRRRINSDSAQGEAKAANTSAQTGQVQVTTAIEATGKAADEWRELYTTLKQDFEDYKTDSLNEISKLRDDLNKMRLDLNSSLTENDNMRREQEKAHSDLENTNRLLTMTREELQNNKDAVGYAIIKLAPEEAAKVRMIQSGEFKWTGN